jgi:LysR family transcriptional regulator, nitrogen assimilation regulatory protein
MTRAAAALHVAQPSLGVQIKLLETEIGVDLLSRHSRGVSPTAAGKAMYTKATSILQQIDALRGQIGGAVTPERRSVALGFPPSAMRLLGVGLLSDAETYAPDITIELTEERSSLLEDALDRNELDIALCYNTREDSKIVRTPILEEELLFVAAPDHIQVDDPVRISDILTMPLVLSGERGIIHGLVQAEADRLNQTFKPAFSIHSVSTLKSIVMQGRAATVLPLGPVAEEVAAGTIACRRIRDRPLFRTLYFVRTRGNSNAEGDELGPLLAHIAERLRSKLGNLARPIGWGTERQALSKKARKLG